MYDVFAQEIKGQIVRIDNVFIAAKKPFLVNLADILYK